MENVSLGEELEWNVLVDVLSIPLSLGTLSQRIAACVLSPLQWPKSAPNFRCVRTSIINGNANRQMLIGQNQMRQFILIPIIHVISCFPYWWQIKREEQKAGMSSKNMTEFSLLHIWRGRDLCRLFIISLRSEMSVGRFLIFLWKLGSRGSLRAYRKNIKWTRYIFKYWKYLFLRPSVPLSLFCPQQSVPTSGRLSYPLSTDDPRLTSLPGVLPACDSHPRAHQHFCPRSWWVLSPELLKESCFSNSQGLTGELFFLRRDLSCTKGRNHLFCTILCIDYVHGRLLLSVLLFFQSMNIV